LEPGVVWRLLPPDFDPDEEPMPPEDEVCAKANDAAAKPAIATVETAIFLKDMRILAGFFDAQM
jgi:hypothetical protein